VVVVLDVVVDAMVVVVEVDVLVVVAATVLVAAEVVVELGVVVVAGVLLVATVVDVCGVGLVGDLPHPAAIAINRIKPPTPDRKGTDTEPRIRKLNLKCAVIEPKTQGV
jgi:hypothetical protein